ncbi:hypothetical protein BCR43DRAFT_494873 [Syncephalastrum racemosum]|uniref:Uncharacterized protein n=1 Tax=Syncephalastrum racemosum TaxID=13706 RepID=A0A1X2H8U8_SYNRA|nr:hypothetical protein BCR43DRAFT_494873 [Syncephalastrum racemosum]
MKNKNIAIAMSTASSPIPQRRQYYTVPEQIAAQVANADTNTLPGIMIGIWVCYSISLIALFRRFQ